MLFINVRPLKEIRALGVGMCTCHISSPVISIMISVDIQFTVIVVGEVLAAKNHNQDIQNYTRKILFICKEP